jgi:hypothetical protein
LQFSCERFDAKALLKKWDSVFITVANSFMAYGSTEEKAVNRALGRGSSAEAHTVMPIAGCKCTAAAHDGKPHAMFVSFPAMPGVPEQCFAFTTSAARDSFMRAVQQQVQHDQPTLAQFAGAILNDAQRKDDAFMRQVFNRHATNEKLSASALIAALNDVAAPLLAATSSESSSDPEDFVFCRADANMSGDIDFSE